jgi:hypothetical protein
MYVPNMLVADPWCLVIELIVATKNWREGNGVWTLEEVTHNAGRKRGSVPKRSSRTALFLPEKSVESSQSHLEETREGHSRKSSPD